MASDRRPKRPWALALLLLAGCAFGARQWAVTHVAHYTGDAVPTTNCLACHLDARGGTIADRVLKPRYRTPADMVVCADGRRILVTARDSDALLVVDARERTVIREVHVGHRPRGVAADAACRTAWVANQESDTISVVDVESGEIEATIPSGFGPAGIAFAEGPARLVLANSLGDDVSVIDPSGSRPEIRLAASRIPVTAAASPGGSIVLVANQLARPARPDDPPVSEITSLDASRSRVLHRYALPGAHLLGGIAFLPGGRAALVTLVRPKNLLPALQVERGWMMTNGFALLDLEGTTAIELPLDDPDSFYADPADVAVTPDGRTAFVSHGGADLVSAIDLESVSRLVRESSAEQIAGLADRLDVSRRYVTARMPVGSNPGRLALSPGGETLYVAERLDDRIGIVDVGTMRRTGGIDLGGSRHESIVRRGEKVFSSSRETLQHQFSCRSCHPDGHMDQLQYDFEPDGLGRNIVDNRTMLGIADTGPFKWNGKNTSIYMQCGIRFARFLTRSQPLPFEDLNALVAYLRSLEPPRNRHRLAGGALTAAQARGRAIFRRVALKDGTPLPYRNRCTTCHAPPLYTNHRSEDVGSISPGDSSPLFDTPQLIDLEMTAPYLHDGKAMSLEEIWTVYNADDTHGYTRDIGKNGLNDLIEYLKTL